VKETYRNHSDNRKYIEIVMIMENVCRNRNDDEKRVEILLLVLVEFVTIVEV
jgi:hypothetical protein